MAGSKAKPIIIIGAGRHGLELDSYLRCMDGQTQQFHLTGYIDENRPRGSVWGSSSVLGDLNDLAQFLQDHRDRVFHYITAAGSNQVRRDLVSRVESLIAQGSKNLNTASIRHPFSFVGTEVEIGDGTCMAPGSIVTTHAKIGRHVILNTKVSVSHDCVIGDYVNLNPGVTVCGNVNIGDGCYIGAGATVLNRINIGPWSVVGAGATVVRDVPPRVTVAGVPAKIIKKHAD